MKSRTSKSYLLAPVCREDRSWDLAFSYCILTTNHKYLARMTAPCMLVLGTGSVTGHERWVLTKNWLTANKLQLTDDFYNHSCSV